MVLQKMVRMLMTMSVRQLPTAALILGVFTINQAASAQPVNDTCDAAQTLTSGSHAFEMQGAGSSQLGSTCLMQNEGDVWFRFVPTTTGPVSISTCDPFGPGTTVGLVVYPGCANIGTAPLWCSTNEGYCGSGSGADLVVAGQAGVPLLIGVIAQAPISADSYTLTIQQLIAPANDECSSPMSVVEGTYPFDTTAARTELPLNCGLNGPSGADVWFRFTASQTGRVTASACNPDGEATLDATVLSLHPQCGALPTRCNDSDCPEDSGASLSFSVTAGSSYLLRLAGTATAGDSFARGAGTLTIVQRTANFPAGDECANPRNVAEGSFTWNNANATTNQLTSTSSPAITKDIWFRYTPTQSGAAFITTCTTGTFQRNTIIATYGTCSGSPLNSNDDAGACALSGGSAVYQRVTAGSPILIRVGTPTASEAGGSGVLNISVVPIPANDNCANAIPIGEGQFTTDLRGSTRDGAARCDDFLFSSDSDVWCSFTAPTAGELSVIACTSSNQIPPFISIHSSCVEQSVHCNETTCPGGGIGATRRVSAGETVLIRVASFVLVDLTLPTSFVVSLEPTCDQVFLPPPDATPEQSPCGEFPDTNNGCRLAGTIAAVPGVTYSGKSSDFEINGRFVRDLDAYLFSVPAETRLLVSGQSQFPTRVTLARADGCSPTGSTPQFLEYAFSTEECIDFQIDRVISAGQYELVIRPERPLEFTPFDCSSGLNDYWFTLAVAPLCDPIDFNADTLFPSDQDLLDFLSVLAGGPCSPDNTCNDIDFNNDGLFPDDNDLITFLRVLAGGDC
jgi:hypothetical protein